MKAALRVVDLLDGVITRGAWIALLKSQGVAPKCGNWTFGRRVPFMVRERELYRLTNAGRNWAYR